MRVRWNTKPFLAKLERHEQRQLDKAAITLQNYIKQSFGNSGVTGTRSGASKKERAANRSKLGNPPNIDTGNLKRNISFAKPVGRPSVRQVGTGIGNAKSVGYAMYLEFGTSRMWERPYLRPALINNRAKLKKILTEKMRAA